jgi:hypothetical protein
MANEYYTAPSPKQPLNIVRSAEYNSNNDGIEAAFDELPPATQLARSQYGQDVSTAATLYEVTIPTLTAGYFEGLEVVFQVVYSNTGAAQIQVNGSTIVAILDTSGQPLVVGDILADQIITAVYTSNNVFQVQFTANSVASAAAAAASAVESASSAGAASASAAAAAASAVELSTIRFGLTTQELIASTEVFTADVIISTSGYAASADGGTGLWIQNGVVGQTASQSPLQLGAALLNDAAGNQWALSVNGPNSVLALGPGASATADMINKNFGLGSANSPIAVSDLNLISNVGFYRISAADSVTSGNSPGASAYTVLHTQFDTVSQTQIAWQAGTQTVNVYTRAGSSAGGYGAWVQIFHSGNTNFNVFGGLAADDRIVNGFALSATSAVFNLPINSFTSPGSFTKISTFKVLNAAAATIATDVTLSFSASSTGKNLVLTAAVTGRTTGEPLVLLTETATSKITVNF